MSTPAFVDPPDTDTDIDRRARIERARAMAEGFVFGALGIHHPHAREADIARAFAIAYADRLTECLDNDPDFVPGPAQAWVAWQTTGDLTADLSPTKTIARRVPGFEEYEKALRDRTASWLCAEALGYVRGWCDAAGVGSGEAVDFAHAYAVAVAAGGSRPNIADAWTNWRAGRPVTAMGH
ncbi:hypothetical protein ACTD5D_22115 [Nocardia takedensis]|uniref:hypothetical protein n=1 Tax=Nocardia takedensis TaxID=259390 RepID=UPI0002E72EA2|nr:hypothetical protein [Nocardia takedensis]